MNCKQAQELIRTLPRSEWRAHERDAVDQHVSLCADCALILQSEQQLDAELRSLFEPEPPGSLAPVVMARIHSQPRHHARAPSRARSVLSTSSRWFGLAAAIGAYLFAFVQGQSSTLPLPQADTVLQALLTPSIANVSTIVFAIGLLLFLVGLFAPWSRSLDVNAQSSI